MKRLFYGVWMILVVLGFETKAQSLITKDSAAFELIGTDSISLEHENIMIFNGGTESFVWVIPKKCSQFSDISSVKPSLTFFMDGLALRKREFPIELKSGLSIPAFSTIYYISCD